MGSVDNTLDQRPQRTHWAGVCAVILCGIVAALQIGKVAIGLPAMRADLGLSLAAGGWVMGMYSLIAVFSGIPVGAGVSRFGDRRLLVVGALALAAGSTVGALAPGLVLLLGGRFVEGIGFILIIVAGPSALDRLTASRHHNRVFGCWSSYMPAGIALALLAGPLLDGWRPFWLANALLALTVAIAAGCLVPAAPRAADGFSWRRVGRDGWETMRTAGPLLLAALFGLYTLQYFALVSFLPVLFIQRMGVSLALSGLLTALTVGVNVAGNLVAGALLDRGLRRTVLIAIAAATMTLTGIGIFLPGMPAYVVFVLCLLFSGVGGLLPVTVLAATSPLAPRRPLVPVSFGLVLQGNNLGRVAGPVLVGGLVDAGGWTTAIGPVALAGGVALVLALAAARRLG